MNDEFKKLSQGDVTRYVLENATGMGSGSVASMPMPVGGTQKRGDNLIAQEADKNTVPASTPRNFVAKNAKTAGAGAHKDKSKTIPRKEKHKKPFMEDHSTATGGWGHGSYDTYTDGNHGRGVAEDEEYDDEAGMADNNIETMKRAVDGLDSLIHKGDNLPEWCQEKIAVAKSMLVTVWDYMASEEQDTNEDMSRRGFLKGAGAMAAGISAASGAHADNQTDPNKLIAIVNIDGESKEFNLTGRFKGDAKSQLHQAENFITEFLEKRDINFSNLELRYQGAVLKTQNTGSVREEQGVAEGAELKKAKRSMNQAAKDANVDQVGAGKKIDTMKNSLRQKDINKQGVTEGFNFNDKKGRWEWDDGTSYDVSQLTPAQKERVAKWKAANPGKRQGRASPDTRGEHTPHGTGAGPRVMEQGVDEGAKVDRQAKHITASMMKKGKSKKDAESIAWAHIKHPKNESVDTYFESLNVMLERQLEPTMDLDTWNNNFQNADPNKYHQFKNKTPEKKK